MKNPFKLDSDEAFLIVGFIGLICVFIFALVFTFSLMYLMNQINL